MYTLDYLNCFIENLDLPEASRASLRENCETLVTTPGAIDELVSAETLLFKALTAHTARNGSPLCRTWTRFRS